MTNEELAIAAKADRGLMLALWQAVERLIASWARKYCKNSETRLYEACDLVQAGYLALADAVAGYDESRGAFTTYLGFHIRSRFAEVAGCRGEKRRPEVYAESLDVPAGEDFDMTKLDMLADPSDAYEDAERLIWLEQLNAALNDALASLPDNGGDLLKERFYEGKTLTAIAADRGVNIEAVRQREGKALQAMRHPRRCKALEQFIELHTNYYHHVGVTHFASTHTSAVEAILLRMERLEHEAARGKGSVIPS